MIAYLIDGRRSPRHIAKLRTLEEALLRRARQFFANLDERGATAVEFAIVGSLFLTLLLGTFELGYMVFVQSVLDSSARTAARLIRTGQAQAASNPQTYFQTAVCNGVSSIIGCGNIIFQVQEFPSWSGSGSVQVALTTPPSCTPPPTPPAKCNPLSGNQPIVFNAGACSTAGSPQIVAVQVAYDYQFFTLWIGQMLGDSNQSAFLISTVVFQNEPYCTNG
jgi:Flp pilus assembly protein TadG